MLLDFYKKDGESFNYLLSLPDVTTEERLPLIVFLHGSGERGDDLERLKRHGIPKYYERLRKLPVITLSPQCEEGKVWVTQVYELKNLIDKIVREYPVDRKRIALTGLSMGGFGAWELAMDFPDCFSCLVPICGGGTAWRAALLKEIPIRAFHGAKDEDVNCFYSQDMVNSVNAAGGYAELTVYPDLHHNSWAAAYENTDVIDWMIRQKRKE